MRRPLPAVLAFGLLAAVLPASGAGAITPPGFDCGPDDGREQLLTEGLTLDFEAPNVFAPELQATRDVTGPAVTTHRAAKFHFRANFAPFRWGDLAIDLDWGNENNDYDLFVFDADGMELARSADPNIEDGTIGERIDLPAVAHCTDFSVEVWNWVGRTDETLTLGMAFANPGPMFECEEDDPHPACEGKEEGDPPDRIDDTRTRLYLGGDRPGQLAMMLDYPFATGNQEPPMQGRLVPERPLGGEPNTFTHTALGNTHQARNPFQAHFTARVQAGTRITGDLHALFWVSSLTMQDGGTLNVDLFADSLGPLAETRVASIEVPGEQIQTSPTLVAVTFEDLDLFLDHDLTLQISTLGVVTTGGEPGDLNDPADAHWTIHYDSVQFPGFIALDLPDSALAS